MLRLLHLMSIGTRRWLVCHPYTPSPSSPRKCS
jgi:hypothetical protein